MQPFPNRRSVVGRNQGIGGAADAVESTGDLRQQIQRRRSASGAHGADTRAVKIERPPHAGQRGRQQCGMASETKSDHIDGCLWTALLKPGDGNREIAENLRRGGGVLMTPALGQIGCFVAEIKIRS